ncbi:MAG: nuclease-related domain-containing protein [Jatrophihabitantaceae bacterium]
MLEKVREQTRERRLGKDARAGRRVRDQVRQAQWLYARRHWRFLGTAVLLGALVIALAAYLAQNLFLRGAVVGAGVVILLGGPAFTVFLFTGSGPQVMGGIAETWTSSELRPLRKHGWKLADHVFYRFADVDHLLVGPGGALVVETKWSAEAWRLDQPDQRLLDHLGGLQRRATDVRRVIPQLRRDESQVRAVLFVWGGGRTGADLPARPVRVAGVDVVYGVAAAKVWRDALAEMPGALSDGDIDDAWERIRKQAAKTDEQDAADPPPPTLARLYWTAAATGFAAVIALLAGICALRLPGGVVAAFSYAAVAAAAGLVARRWAASRYPALGWLTGVGFFTVLLVGLELLG